MESVTWIAVAMAAVSMLGNAVTVVSNNVTKRETEAARLAHDADLLGVKAALAATADRLTACEADRVAMRADLSASQADRLAIREKLAELTGRMAAAPTPKG